MLRSSQPKPLQGFGVKKYDNKYFTELTTEIYENLDGKKIQKLAQKVFAEDQVELVMKPSETAALK